MEQLLRNFFLFLSKNQAANAAAKKWGLRFGASRFVAGVTIQNAISTIHELNKTGILATLDHLGEFVCTEQEANESTTCCIQTLEEIYAEKVNSNLSLKLTQLGLDISKELCVANIRRILDTAKKYNNFVRIDMEDYAHNEMTLDILRQLISEGYDNVSTVLQAYLYKTEQDIEDLNTYHLNLRLVKGAYKEPKEVAFPQKADVDRNYLKIIEKHVSYGNYAAIASHDENIIHYVKQFVKQHNIPNNQFEFQMLYGIRTQLQQQLADEGYTMRVYVPYGNDWYGYFMRRLAERPANVGFVVKGVLKK